MPLRVRETGATFEDSDAGLEEATEHAAEVADRIGRTVNVVRENGEGLDRVVGGIRVGGAPIGQPVKVRGGWTVTHVSRNSVDVVGPDHADRGIFQRDGYLHWDDPAKVPEYVKRAAYQAVGRPDIVEWEEINVREASEGRYGTQSYLTSVDQGPSYPRHAHCAWLISPDADGRTSYDADHDHKVVAGVVQSADDGHDHDLMPEVTCPAPYSLGEGKSDIDIDFVIDRWSGYRLPDGIARAEGLIPRDFDRDALAHGIEVELEHTSDIDIALAIAMDHLAEDPLYYERLARIEAHDPPGRRLLPSTWTDSDVRKYEAIKSSQLDAGAAPEDAKRIAAATVNRDRAERGAEDDEY